MKKLSSIAILAIPLFLLISCKPKQLCTDAEEAVLRNMTGLDGCSWVLVLENGQKLEPLNLGEFDIEKKDGRKVYVSYYEEKEYMSICMVGPIVRVTCICRR